MEHYPYSVVAKRMVYSVVCFYSVLSGTISFSKICKIVLSITGLIIGFPHVDTFIIEYSPMSKIGIIAVAEQNNENNNSLYTSENASPTNNSDSDTKPLLRRYLEKLFGGGTTVGAGIKGIGYSNRKSLAGAAAGGLLAIANEHLTVIEEAREARTAVLNSATEAKIRDIENAKNHERMLQEKFTQLRKDISNDVLSQLKHKNLPDGSPGSFE